MTVVDTPVKGQWARRFDESGIVIGRDVSLDALEERYAVDTREEIVDLTNEATMVMIERGETQIWLKELDEAAERLGVLRL